jgi:hypothetical protein
MISFLIVDHAGERYASARAFADDLEVHLHHRPVMARGQNFGYRAGNLCAAIG